MAPDVGQCFLYDANHLDTCRARDLGRKPIFHDELELAALADLAVQVDDRLHGADQRPFPGALQPQVVDGVVQARDRPLERLDLVFYLSGPVRALGHPPENLHRLQGVREVLQPHVVQLAGYAAALGLPDLAQRLLGPLALGNVLYGALVARDPAPGVVDGARVDGDPHVASVFAKHLHLEAAHEAVPQREPVDLLPAFRLRVELATDVRDGLQQLLRGLVAEHAGHRGVGRQEPPLDRRLEDPLDGVLEDGAVLILGLPPLGDVLVDEHDLLDLAVGVPYGVDERLYPAVGDAAHVGDAGAGFVPYRRYGGCLPSESPLDVGHDAFLDELGVPQHIVPRYLVEPDAPELLPRPVDPQRPAIGGEDLGAKGGL